MNPSFPHQTGNLFYPPDSRQQHTAYDQYANNGPYPAKTIPQEQVNYTNPTRTQGLKPSQQHFHVEQFLTTPLQPGRVRAGYTHQTYINQQPQHRPVPPATSMFNCGASSTNRPATYHQSTNHCRGSHLTADNNPYIPAQAHQVNNTFSTNLFSSPGVSSYPNTAQWSQPPAVKPAADLTIEKDNDAFLREMCESQPYTARNQMHKAGPAFTTCQPARTPGSRIVSIGAYLPGATESAPLPCMQGNHAFHQPAVTYHDFRAGGNADATGYGYPPFTETPVKSDKLVHDATASSSLKRSHNPDWNHPENLEALQPIKFSRQAMAYNSGEAMSSSSSSHTSLYPASQMKQMMPPDALQRRVSLQTGYCSSGSVHAHKGQFLPKTEAFTNREVRNVSTPLEQNLTASPSHLVQPTMLQHSVTSTLTPASSSTKEWPCSSPLSTPTVKSEPTGFDTLQQSMGTPDTRTRKTSKETQQLTPTPESNASDDIENLPDFHPEAPEFDRQSKEIKSLIRESQRILGIQDLDLPWITTAHILIIAADAIDGFILETTMHILRFGHVNSLPDKPDNPLENVDQKIAEVVSDWYGKSESHQIKDEYIELLNTVNRYRKEKNKLTFQNDAAYNYKSVLKKAAAILRNERNTKGTHHLPAKNERANLLEFIQSAIEGSAKETFKEQEEQQTG
ncbi:hypothetical protein [Endozoicomonas atrinae]|uniref:hypothetical protein n=1 Tax=Endozoicomonas atrinae TaxID=1333660 RepID=UPI000AC5D21D|nr:hypothetical protein [Endozoicomonas atrinae]